MKTTEYEKRLLLKILFVEKRRIRKEQNLRMLQNDASNQKTEPTSKRANVRPYESANSTANSKFRFFVHGGQQVNGYACTYMDIDGALKCSDAKLYLLNTIIMFCLCAAALFEHSIATGVEKHMI